MDAKVPSGPAEKIVLPFSLWLMKHTMLGNPLIKPWKELAEIAKSFTWMSTYSNHTIFVTR